MNSPSKQIKLVIKGGVIHAIYDDELVGLFPFNTVTVKRASHVEPHELYGGWYADMRPVDGPVMVGFLTRQQALDAERNYLDQHVVT